MRKWVLKFAAWKTKNDIFYLEELKKKWGINYARKLDKYGIVAMGME